MSTHDYVIANASGSAVRSDINNVLAAIVSNNSSSSEPSTKYAYMLWADTTNNLIKLRNSANNAWITLFTTTGGLSISAASTFNEDVTFDGATSGRDMVWDRSDNALEFASYAQIKLADQASIRCGTDEDLKIFHSGANAHITHVSEGNMFIDAVANINFRNEDGTAYKASFNDEGSCKLYYDGGTTPKLETISTGVNVTSTADAVLQVTTTGTGTGDDARLELITQESTFTIQNDRSLGTDGALTISPGSEAGINIYKDGAVELYFNNGKVLETGPNASNVRVSGFFEALWDQADAEYVYNGSAYAFHKAQNSNANWVMAVENSNDSQPYGFLIKFSDAAPDNNTEEAILFADNAASRFIVYSDGDAWTSDAGTLSSDRTLKENITDATSKLEDIKKLKVRNFNWKASYHPEKSKKKQIGFIAQEVEEVFPSLVNEYDISPDAADKDHTPVMKKAIKAAWDPIIIKAMQELITKVETLETKVAALEG